MRLRKSVLFLASLAFCVCLSAADVGDILVESTVPGVNQDILQQLVVQAVSLRSGKTYDLLLLSNDLKALVKTGKFQNVSTKIRERADGRVDITYVVTPKPVVTAVRFTGLQEYKERSIRRLVKHPMGIPLDETLLAKDRSEILEKYRRAGYYGTTVSTIRETNENGGITLHFVVREEIRHKLHRVYFQGNTVYPQSELRRQILTRRQWWRYILRLGNYFNREQQDADREMLQALYFKKGHLDFAVRDIQVRPLKENPKWVDVIYTLEEGRPYTIQSIAVTGMTKYSQENLLNRTQARAGDTYNSAQEELDIQLMRAEYDRNGYLDLQIFPKHIKDAQNAKVDIVYQVHEGLPITIRNIYTTGNEITQDRVIRRELAIAPGDKGDQRRLQTSRARLMNLGYFESVEILPIPTGDEQVRDLRIELKEKATGQLSLGAGYSTEDSAIGFLEFTESNFDLQRLFNWPPKGAGQRVRSRLQFGSHSSNFLLSHTEPWLLDRRLELQTELFYRNLYEDEYDQRDIGGGQILTWPVAFRVPFSEHVEHWNLGIGYRISRIRISDADTHAESRARQHGDFIRGRCIKDEEDSKWANRLITQVSRDTRNAYRFPTKGSLTSLQTEFVSKALGSYEDYIRFDAGFTCYSPLVRDLILKLHLNYCTSTGGDDTAIFDRYFAGGIGTIRGFRRRDIAPRDRFDDPLGGNSYLTGTVEIIKPVLNFMFASIFLDGGNVWWEDHKLDWGDLNYSVGFGVQFRALPISIYYGYPISTTWDHLKNRSGRIHFNIGLTY